MHLGSDRSILTSRAGTPVGVSEVLLALVSALRSIVSANEGHRPVLILNGDCFELALASDEVSAAVFQEFMRLVMVSGDELFSSVCFIPGNHDHHLWESARESQFSKFLSRHDPSEPIPHPWYATRALLAREQHPVESPLLTTLLRRARRLTGETEADSLSHRVTVSYPNLAIERDGRCVIFHHGHFIEPAYKLLTSLNTALFSGPVPQTVSELEEGNFAWIDFFWSALGRAGDPGDRIQFVYDRLRDPQERSALIRQLSANLAKLVKNRTESSALEDALQARIMAFLIGQASGWLENLGRRAYYGGTTAVRSHDVGLTEYLERYVHRQLSDESPALLADEITFVFGHTHHPLVRLGQPYVGFADPVRVCNTGGWVHETAGLQDQVGASVVLVSEDLDVAAVEVYREVSSMSRRYVRLVEPSQSGSHSAFFDRVSSMLDETSEPWRRLVSTVESEIEQRRAHPIA